MATLLALKAASGGLPVAVAWTAKLLLDELAAGTGADPRRAAGLALAGAAAGVAGQLVSRATEYTAALVRARVTVAAERQLFAAVNRSPGLRHLEDPEYFDRLQLADQATQDAPQTVTEFGTEVVQSTVRGLGFLAALLALWPPMALVLLVAAVPELLAQRAVARHQVTAAERLTTVNRWRFRYRMLLTDARAGKEIRLFGLGGLFHDRILRLSGAAVRTELAVERRAAFLDGGTALLGGAAVAAGSVVAVYGVVRGELTVGDLMLFLSAVGGVQGALSAVLHQYGRTAEAVALFRHFVHVCRAPADVVSGPVPAPPLRHAVEFRDVWFRYQPHQPWVLRGVTFTVRHGEATGLVGVNGAGKSTLVKLLCRMYDPQHGQILWDGTDLRDLDIASLRRRIGATFQDYMTYDLTAAENIGLGDPAQAGDPAAVMRAAVLAGAHDTVTNLPKGYRTLLSRAFLDDTDGEPGVTLSGGQWQRLALARSLMRHHADLLILDEPSSGLDAVAEHEVHTTLRRHREGRTSLLISHRLSALRDAHRIAVLAGGQLVEEGDHDQLMRADGYYARLFTVQATGYQDDRVPQRESQ